MKKILQWYGSDIRENYKSIIFEEPNYTQDEITYEFTSDDYRITVSGNIGWFF